MTRPRRTCVGCGVTADPRSLARLRLDGARVVMDARGERGGRGAWLHPSEGCLAQAVKRRAFARAFRAAVEVDEAALRVQLTGRSNRD
ncbi:MAG TPA: YlxR family protein [Anaeromyxobacteraceae bacterium]|nr:YlxR family protein [Anaeromyxobacteraceae bacterium]